MYVQATQRPDLKRKGVSSFSKDVQRQNGKMLGIITGAAIESQGFGEGKQGCLT